MESKSLLLNLDPILANITIAQSIRAGLEPLNAEMGTCGLKLVSIDCLQQLDVMLSKAHKIQAGQLTLSFVHLTDQGAALLDVPFLTLLRSP